MEKIEVQAMRKVTKNIYKWSYKGYKIDIPVFDLHNYLFFDDISILTSIFRIKEKKIVDKTEAFINWFIENKIPYTKTNNIISFKFTFNYVKYPYKYKKKQIRKRILKEYCNDIKLVATNYIDKLETELNNYN